MPSWKKVIISGSDAALNSLTVTNGANISGSLSVTGSAIIQGSGSAGNTTLFAVDGNSGRLFSIDDSLSDSLFSVNTIAGLPVIEAFADNTVNIGTYGSEAIIVNGTTASITGSLFGTASWALNALTSSYSLNPTVSGSISTVDWIDFKTGSDQPQTTGRLGWDDGNGTLNLGLKGGNVNLAIGQEMVARVYNADSVTLTDGMVVYISGSQGNRVAVKRASAAAELGSANTLGMVTETITAGAEGFITTQGVVNGLNTTGLTAGALIYLSSSAGQYTMTRPTAPVHTVVIGYVERIHATVGSIYVKVDNGYELEELHNVIDNSTTSSYGDLLAKSGSVWINSRQLTGSYGLTGSLQATSFTGSFSGSHFGPLTGTASYATQALSASYSISSSNALTASNITPAITNDGDTRVLTANGNGTLNGEGNLTFDGSTLKATGTISGSTVYSTQHVEAAVNLKSLFSSGDEGGEIFLNKPVTNTSINTGVNIDVYQNKLRIWEAGGTNRGGYYDITALGAGVGTNLLGGSGTVTSVSASGTVSGITLGGGPISGAGTLTLSGTISGLTNSNLSGTAGITNANLANPSLMIGTTNIALGATGSSLTGLSSVSATTFTGALTGNASTATSASYAATASFLNGSTTNAFIQNGNSFGATAVLGTNDNQSLALETNGTTRMFVSSSGNVGIGTTSPTYKLDVQGSTLLGSSISTQGAFNINLLAPPPVITGYTLSTGSSLGVGNYYYFVTYVTAVGETSRGSTLTVTTTSGTTTVDLTGIPISNDPRVIARKLYRTKLNGSSDNQFFLATINNNTTTTYTDSIADASLTGLGAQSYKINTTSRFITVSGVQAMIVDDNLTAIGKLAGNSLIATNAAAVRTVLVGATAGQNITTGVSNVIVGVAGYALTTGGSNSLLGDLALGAATTGAYNTVMGSQAGRYLTTSNNNVIIGASAGNYLNNGITQLTTPSNSVYIGTNTRGFSLTETNSIVIGNTALGLGSNTVVLGNDSIVTTALKGNVGIGTTAPGAKLEVNGGAIGNNIARFTTGATGGGTRGLTVYSDNSQVKLQVTDNLGNPGTWAYLNLNPDGGNVGIGTTTPSSKLHIKGNGSTSATTALRVENSDATPSMVVLDNGNVGIGVTDPISKLDIDVNEIGGYNINLRNSAGPLTSIQGSLGVLASSNSSTFDYQFGPLTVNPATYGFTFGMYDVFYGNVDEGYIPARTTVGEFTNSQIWNQGLNVGIGTTSPSSKLHVYGGNIKIEEGTGGDEQIEVSGGYLAKYNGLDNAWGFAQGRIYINGDTENTGIGTTSPNAKLDVEGDVLIKAANLSNQENLDVDTGTEVIATVAIATYTAAFFDFVIKNGTNVRSGTVFACHDGTNVEYTETSTADLGNTTPVTLSVDISGTDMRLLATTTTDNWIVKSLVRAL